VTSWCAGFANSQQTYNPMKNENKTATVLAALSYLIERQGLTAEQVNELIITTIEELNETN